MKADFRHEARSALKRAQAELNSADPERLKYAALELRMAMEAITYDRAQAYKDEIPPGEYSTWQPKKLMQLLLSIAPMADQGSTLSFGLEEEYGVPAKEMHCLGTEKVFDLAALKEHYDALGSYLHIPSLKRMQSGTPVDLAKLKQRCEAVVSKLEAALASPHFNSTLGSFATLECLRCKKPVRRRIPNSGEQVDARCFECQAEYIVTGEGADKSVWTPRRQTVKCQTAECAGQTFLWSDQCQPGTGWRCESCQQEFTLGLAVFKKEPATEGK